MTSIYKSAEGARAVRERYLDFLQRWPIANEQLRVPTRQGETFIVACGNKESPPLLLLHGSAANSAMWMHDVALWARHFRTYAVDIIGEPGLSAPSRPPLDSDACALWLEDVTNALAISKISIVGVSLGGWLALDYATRRPQRVASLVLLSPGGVGRQKFAIILKAIALRICGGWGRRKIREMILGRAPADIPDDVRQFSAFVSIIHESFRPRLAKLPVFSDDALKGLTMPVLAILGGQDVFLDSAATKRRLDRNVSRAEIHYLPKAGHFVSGQTTPILEFLRRSPAA